MADDDAVLFPGRDPGDEAASPVRAGQVVGLADEELGAGVELEPLAAELVDHMVRDHDHGLGGQSEAAQLHRGHHHLGGLARPDLVGEQRRRLGHDAGHRGELVRPRLERQRQAGQDGAAPS